MLAWDLLVDAFRTVLVVTSHALGGSLGGAIIGVSLAVRLLLLPLTVKVALRARAMQRRLKAIEPELARLRKRYADDPRELVLRTQALHEKHGIALMPKGSALSAVVQVPLGGALYRALVGGLGAGQRFGWIADLARPDAGLAVVAALLAAAAAASGASPAEAGRSTWLAHGATILSAVVALVIVSRVAAGVGLYWAASSAVGVLQGALVRRADARTARSA